MLSEIEKMYNKVFATCTDNENKINLMRSLFKKKTYPTLLIYGFSAHVLNLCVKEIIPSNAIKHILEAQTCFRNKHSAHVWLKEKNGLISQIQNDTI